MGVNVIPAQWELAAATTLSNSDLNMWHHINCSTAANLTLPTPAEGDWIGMFNYGTQTITVKNPSASSIGTVLQYAGSLIYAFPNSSGIASWPTALADLPGTFALTAEPTT